MTRVICRECKTSHDGPSDLVAHMRIAHMTNTSTLVYRGITITVAGKPGVALDETQSLIWATLIPSSDSL